MNQNPDMSHVVHAVGSNEIAAVAVGPRTGAIAVLVYDTETRCFAVQHLHPTRTLWQSEPLEKYVEDWHLMWSHDEALIFCAQKNESGRFINVGDGTVRPFPGHKVTVAAFSPIENVLAFSYVWSPQTGLQLARVGPTDIDVAVAIPDNSPYGIVWSPNGQRIMAFSNLDNRCQVYNVATQTTSPVSKGSMVAWAPDSEHYVVTADDNPSLSIWKHKQTGSNGYGDKAGFCELPFVARRVAWSPDGTHIAASSVFLCDSDCSLVALVRVSADMDLELLGAVPIRDYVYTSLYWLNNTVLLFVGDRQWLHALRVQDWSVNTSWSELPSVRRAVFNLMCCIWRQLSEELCLAIVASVHTAAALVDWADDT